MQWAVGACEDDADLPEPDSLRESLELLLIFLLRAVIGSMCIIAMQQSIAPLHMDTRSIYLPAVFMV